MSKATKKQARQWMLFVMGRQQAFTGPNADKDAEAAVQMSIEAFIAKFPAQSLCAASIDHVAGAVRYWSEAAVMASLEAWQRSNEPAGPALPAQAEAAPVSRQAKTWLATWYRAEDDRQAGRALDLIKSQNDEAYGYLCRNDMRAADMAVARRMHIPLTAHELASDWDDEQGIRDRVRRLGELRTSTERPYDPKARGGAHDWPAIGWSVAAKMLVDAVALHAPQHKWALLEELRWLQHGRPSGPVTLAPSPITAVSLFGD